MKLHAVTAKVGDLKAANAALREESTVVEKARAAIRVQLCKWIVAIQAVKTVL